jgi:hypothetical protein
MDCTRRLLRLISPSLSALRSQASDRPWYHLRPTNDTLLWDRLPMTIAFMGLFSAILTEHIDRRARRALPWLLALGLGSVVYWSVS